MKIRNLDVTRNPSNEQHQRLPPVEATVTHPHTHPVKNKLIKGLCSIVFFLGAVLPSLAAADVTLLGCLLRSEDLISGIPDRRNGQPNDSGHICTWIPRLA